MATPKDILVVTSSTLEGVKIKRYLKPVSAHIVAGTNLFSDFMGGLTDVFGGRSQAYQKQLASLYNEAIERIKYAAYEIGGNCVIGLNIDMDEISGKGKSMFMLTAIGTVVVLEKEPVDKLSNSIADGKLENVGVDRINVLRKKKSIIERANTGELKLTDNNWSFITTNQVEEVFSYIIQKFSVAFKSDQYTPGSSDSFYKLLLGYIDGLDEDKKLTLLYETIEEETDEAVVIKMSQIVKELNLYDFNSSFRLLKSNNFQTQKRGLRLVTYDKPFYNNQDKYDLQTLSAYIKDNFPERGTRTSKKQLLSKEKEVWVCECGKTNDLEEYCSGCKQDIYGFKEDEVKPQESLEHLNQKIDLIDEFIL